MASKPTVKKNTGIFATAVCAMAALMVYAYYLMQTNQHLDVQAAALSGNWYQFKPAWAKQIVSAGGFTGTVAALLLIMLQGALGFAVAFVGTYFGFKHFTQKPEQSNDSGAAKGKPAQGVNNAEIIGSDLMVMLPKYPGKKKGEWVGGKVDKAPYAQNFYRIDKAPVGTRQGVELTPHKRLYISIYSMLKAHPNVPASIGSHHADTDLFEHSLSVAKKVQEHFAGRGKVEPLAQIAGLAHDLDKLLAYKKNGDSWVKSVNATHHNKYAAYIVSTQPEFRELPEEDRNILVLALRYYHDPDNLPIGASNRTEALIQALRMCDGYAIKEEKAAAVESLTDEHMESIEHALLDTISELNINGYLNNTGHAGGWTTPALEYVITPMSTVLELLGKHLPADLNRKLQLDHETRTFTHPASRLVSQRLNKLGLLMSSYKSFESEHGLYDCRIGSTRFRAVIMIQKQELEKLRPGLQEKWGSAAYRVRITSATADNTVQGDSDVDEEDNEKEA